MSKNILIITDFMSSGGATTFTRGFTNELLKDKDNHLTIIYFYDYGNNPIFENKSIKYFSIPLNTNDRTRIKTLPKRIFLLNKLFFKLDQISFDIVYTDLIYPTFAFQIIRLFYPSLHSTPLYHHIHGSLLQEIKSQESDKNTKPNLSQKIKYQLLYKIEHFTLKNCQSISVNSLYSQKLTKKFHGNLPLKINKPGIDFSFSAAIRKLSKSAARIKLGLNPKGKYILITSRIEPRKGVTLFLQNLSNHKFNNTKILVCNHLTETNYLNDFLEKLDQSKQGSNVFLINSPSRYQLSLLYRAADVTALPSIDLETFGFSTLESYYFHTPVVAFDIGANSELIPPSHLVKYLPKNSWQKLYQKINYLLKHPDSTNYSKYQYSWKEYIKFFLSII